MSELPILASVPHAGLSVPCELVGRHLLSAEEIAHDGDEGAASIYAPLRRAVTHVVSTEIARAFVDQNRPEDDRRRDGVVKTHTCWNVPIYKEPLDDQVVETLLARYHRPYHARLSALANDRVKVAVDCHTMAAVGPPVGPDTGSSRPMVCLGDVGHTSCPQAWTEHLAVCFERFFPGSVTINEPFAGGWITRRHASEMPWVQIELSRDPVVSDEEKAQAVLSALTAWCTVLR